MSTRHIAAEHARLSDLTPQGSSGRASKRFRQKLATDGFTVDEGFRLKPGYLYTVVRAISARVNQNFDGWPSDELKKSYKTFIGKPVFVNHENHDPTKARGVVVAARYVENGPDRYVEVVQEVDAERFPKLAHEIKTGGLDSVSMGAEAGFTICSYCHNKATDVPDMCDHVLNHKGKTLTRFDRRTGKKEDVLVFESCHKISFFELSYVFEPADETAVASKVVVASKQVRVDERDDGEVCRECHRADGGGHWPGCPQGLNAFTYQDPDDNIDPFDPRLIGASKQAAWGKTQHGDLANSMGEGHRLHVFSPHVAPAIKDSHPIIPGESIVPEGGSRQHEWVHTRHGEPINSGFAPTQQEAVKAAEQSHQELTGGWDPDSDLFDPRQFGASTARPETPVRDPKWNRPRNKRINDDKRRWRDVEVGDDPQAAVGDEDDPFDPRSYTASNDLAIPAPPGTPTIPQEVINNTPVIQLQPATELTGHEAPGVKQSGKYTKEDFAAAGGKKPWESDAESDAEDADAIEIEAMRLAGICLPGQPCFNNMAQGEQITKDSPNNPVNQPEAGAAAGGAAGGAGGSAGSSPSKFDISQWKSADDYAKSMHGKPYEYGGGGGSGNGSVDCSGYMSDIYSIYSGKPTRFTTDSDFAALGFQPGYKDGAFNIGTDGGVGTGGHMAGTMPDGTKVESGGTNGVQYGGAAIGAQDFAQQWHYPVSSGPAAGVAPTQRAASATDDYEMWKHEHGEEADRERGPRPALENRNLSDWAHRIDMMDRKFSGVIHELVCNGGVSATAPVRTAASLGTGRVPRNLQGLVGTWIRHQTIQYGPDGKPMRNEQGRVLRVPAQPLDPRKPVFVHYNFPAVKLQKQTGVPQPHLWSVEQDGYVRGYTNRLHLTGGDQGQVALNVQKSGADKSLRTKVRNVHAGAEGFLTPHPEQPLPYSKINYDPMRDYDPAAGTNFFYHEDDYNQPVTSSDEMHFSQHAQMHGFQADNWGRSTPPQLVFPPPPDLNASNLDTVRTDIIEQAKLRGQRPSQRSSSLKKIARRRALKLAWGEQEAPMAVDTLREEGSAPEDDDDDFERYVDPPKDLQTPDLSEAQQVDREQELAGATPDQMGGVPGAAEGDPAATPQASQQPQQQYLTLQIPMPSEAPQVPMQAAPPVAAPAPAEDPAMQQPPMQMSASVLDYFDNYYGRRVANWLDAIEAGRDFTPAEAADYRRQAEKLSTLQNGRGLSTTNRNSTKGTATMARSTIASRSEVARAGRRQHFAEGPLVDGGERGRNDQGEQEEAFISQTPPPVAGDYPEDDTPNISNTEHNLVARVQQGRAQLLRDAQQLASLRQRRAFDEAGGPTAVVVDPRVNTGPEGEALTGDDFISADPNDGVVPTNPKDASLRAFKAFDGWLAQKTGSSSRRHSEATIKKAAAQFSREAGISPQALFPALGIVLREARKNDKQANTKGAKMRKRSNESLDVAAPDGRVDVEAPVENVTSAEAQASQFDLHDFGDNAGDNVAKPDLSTDQNWAPGEASGNKTSARVKTAGGLLAMRCAEGMIAAGLEPNSRERKYALAAEFERMNRGLIQDRVALLERFASVREADRRKVASGSSRGAARSPIPAGLGGGTRTASAGPRLAAHDPSNDSSLFI